MFVFVNSLKWHTPRCLKSFSADSWSGSGLPIPLPASTHSYVRIQNSMFQDAEPGNHFCELVNLFRILLCFYVLRIVFLSVVTYAMEVITTEGVRGV